MKTRNKTALLISLIIIALVLVYVFIAPKSATAPVVENKQELKDTYTYTNHGFSIELPKGYIPVEMESEGGPAISISLPSGNISYVTNANFWEKNVLKNSHYEKEEKIGDTIFKMYGYAGDVFYWFKHGDVGYEFSADVTRKQLETFKFIGWPQIEGSKEDLISFSITPGQEVSGKIKVTGTIKGGYFFEGNLPMIILDANKNITLYGPGHATATTDWMTAGPVSFETEFDFSTMPKGKAYIKIIQDDPSGGESGIPVQSVIIPIVIK